MAIGKPLVTLRLFPRPTRGVKVSPHHAFHPESRRRQANPQIRDVFPALRPSPPLSGLVPFPPRVVIPVSSVPWHRFPHPRRSLSASSPYCRYGSGMAFRVPFPIALHTRPQAPALGPPAGLRRSRNKVFHGSTAYSTSPVRPGMPPRPLHAFLHAVRPDPFLRRFVSCAFSP